MAITKSTVIITSQLATSWTHSTHTICMAVGRLVTTGVATQTHLRMERGEHAFCQRGDLVASVWMDKKPVTMLSTLAQADVTHTAQRRQRDGTKLSVQCTDAVVLHNRYMAGVDKGDQLRQYYRVRIKCCKNYKYIFWFLFDVAITNSYILSLFTPTSMPLSHQQLKTFRMKLADQLVGSYNTRKHLGRPRSLPAHPPPALPPSLDHGPRPTQSTRIALHLPSHMEKKRRCVHCLRYRDPPQWHEVILVCLLFASLVPRTAQIASGSGINISCSMSLFYCYIMFVILSSRFPYYSPFLFPLFYYLFTFVFCFFSPLCHACTCCTCSMCMYVCCNSVLYHVSMGTPYKHVFVFIFCLSLVLSGLNQSTSTWCPMVTAHIGAG